MVNHSKTLTVHVKLPLGAGVCKVRNSNDTICAPQTTRRPFFKQGIANRSPKTVGVSPESEWLHISQHQDMSRTLRHWSNLIGSKHKVYLLGANNAPQCDRLPYDPVQPDRTLVAKFQPPRLKF